MICKNCGREHGNIRGTCPFCGSPTHLKKYPKPSSAEQEEVERMAKLREEVDRNWHVTKQRRRYL